MSAQRSGVSGDQKYTRGAVCPICGGSEDDHRGTGKRCYGYVGGDGKYAHCTREEFAGGMPTWKGSEAFAHKLKGDCKCGVNHSPADEPARPKRGARAGRGDKGVCTAEYTYRSQAGDIVFQVQRFVRPDGEKTFIQRQPNPAPPHWAYHLRGVTKPLYGLPELAAADPALPVYLVEGEKDAERVRAAGLVATCCAGGAKGWRREYAASLAGRHVRIIVDNDDPGREFGESAAQDLRGVAASVRMIDLVQLARDLGHELPEKGDASDYLDMGGTVEAIDRAFLDAPEWQPVRLHKPDERPEIEITPEWHLAHEQAIRVIGTDPTLYQRAGQIVRIAVERKATIDVSKRVKITKVAGTPKIVAVSESNIGNALTKVATFFRWKEDKNGEFKPVTIPPTRQLVNGVATNKEWPDMRILDAIAECPYPREDGSIVDQPGYDPETQTFLSPGITFLPVPERPTHEDAIDAWERISDVVTDFPFATEDDRIVYLAGLLTIIARPAIEGAVPGIALIGNRAGTGKGLLVDAMVMPGTGRICPVSTYPDTVDEAKKVKVSIAKAAKVAVHFDNLQNGETYGGSTDSALTTLESEERLLLSNEMPNFKLRTAWFLSGNNISPAKDAHRRWLVIRLETEHENPEERTDIKHKKLRKHLTEVRAELVRDALTILRAHAQAGRPAPNWGAFGTFEDWDEVVRCAVWFATGRDCRTSQKVFNDEAPERNENLALLAAFWQLPGAQEGHRGVTTDEAIREVQANPTRYEALAACLMTRGRAGKPADSRQLGNLFKALANNTIGPYRLVKHPVTKRHAVAWIVRRLDGAGCESSESGESVSKKPKQVFESNKCAITFAIKTKMVLEGAVIDSPVSPDSHDPEPEHGDAWEGDPAQPDAAEPSQFAFKAVGPRRGVIGGGYPFQD